MKTHLFFSALLFVLLPVACQKENPIELIGSSNSNVSASTERCGCLPPVAFEVNNITSVSADLSWYSMPEATGYRVEVSDGSPDAENDGDANFLIIEITEDNQLTLTNLSPGSQYQYRVTTLCRSMESSASGTQYFETKEPVSSDPDFYPTKSYHDH